MGERDAVVYLMEHAFETGEFHGLMGNLESVDQDMWTRRLPESLRTIGEIALHVGSSKVMYTNHAFGDGSLTWESPEVQPWPVDAAPMAATIAWLREVHASLLVHVRQLDDSEFSRLRMANWGEAKETRWLLSTLLQHDVYHAGEINRMRSILSGEDRWQWEIAVGVDRSPEGASG